MKWQIAFGSADIEAMEGEAFRPQFERYIGIDYSGAETPESSCKDLRVYVAEGSGSPEQVRAHDGAGLGGWV
jgi:hypothetical protein